MKYHLNCPKSSRVKIVVFILHLHLKEYLISPSPPPSPSLETRIHLTHTSSFYCLTNNQLEAAFISTQYPGITFQFKPMQVTNLNVIMLMIVRRNHHIRSIYDKSMYIVLYKVKAEYNSIK